MASTLSSDLIQLKLAHDFRRDLSSILTRPPPPFDHRLLYGSDPRQFPRGKGAFPLLFVVHGGFWQSEYDLAHTGHLCTAFTSQGIITCNLEYQRLGDPGGAGLQLFKTSPSQPTTSSKKRHPTPDST